MADPYETQTDGGLPAEHWEALERVRRGDVRFWLASLGHGHRVGYHVREVSSESPTGVIDVRADQRPYEELRASGLIAIDTHTSPFNRVIATPQPA